MKKDAPLSPIGAEIVGALTSFLDTLRAGGDIAERFTVRTVELDLKPRVYSGEDVKKVRDSLNLSQTLFAQFLGVSVKTIRSWERGVGEPSALACRFLDEISFAPEHWQKRLRALIVAKGSGRQVNAH